MTRAYYNEIEPYAAEWLRNLIAAKLIADGDVDERDIRDVRPNDLRGYAQCHFFAGIGVWSFALRLAGWPDDRPVWTGSCPCQPFSAAGRRNGFVDERHLWPAWHHLIWHARPPIIFGGQVAAKAVEPWVELVQSDVEAMGYAFGAVPIPAASIGAPHIRDRLWWVADAKRIGLERGRAGETSNAGREKAQSAADGLRHVGELADAVSARPQGSEQGRKRSDTQRSTAQRSGAVDGMVGAEHFREMPSTLYGFWRDADWLLCRDGRWRPVEPGTFPLAHRAPARVGRLRAYGNAIVPWVAAEFIAAVMEARGEQAVTLLDVVE